MGILYNSSVNIKLFQNMESTFINLKELFLQFVLLLDYILSFLKTSNVIMLYKDKKKKD